MAELIPGFGGFLEGSFSAIGYWIGYALLIVIVLGALIVGYYYMSFPYKINVITLMASGTKDKYAVGRIKTNFAKPVRRGNAWRSMFPFMNNKDREPIGNEFMYAGKKIFVYELNGEWIPARILVNQDGEDLNVCVKAVPNHLKNWQEMENKKNAMEFANHDWWDDNKTVFTAMVVCLLCLAAACVTIYFTYKYAGGGQQAMTSLSDSIRNMNVIQGQVPR